MNRHRHFLAAVVVAVSMCALIGCANHSTTTGTASNSDAGSRTYNSEDLARTGKRTSAEALQAADPAVSTSSGR